jgi:Mg2+ and Co2+ transporter CorA
MSRKRASDEQDREGCGVTTRSRVKTERHQELLAALLEQLVRQIRSACEKISNRVESVEESTINLEGYMEKFEVLLERLVVNRANLTTAAAAAATLDGNNSNSAATGKFHTDPLPFDTLNEKPF